MLILTQNNCGFVDLFQVASVHAVQTGAVSGRIEAVTAFGQRIWLGDYGSVERANEVLMKLYRAVRANNKDFTMPPKKECNADYCDI